MSYILATLVVISSVIVYLIICYISSTLFESSIEHIDKENFSLVVGILSSRQNFEKRDIIRKFLKKSTLNSSVLIKFIVGAIPCSIPIQERLNPYECIAVPPTKASLNFYYSHHLISTKIVPNVVSVNKAIGFDFKVNGDIVIEELGVVPFEISNATFVKVSLFDVVNQIVIASCLFTTFSRGVLIGGYSYKKIKKVVLKRGFLGSILIDEFSTDGKNVINILQRPECTVNDGGGIILFRKGYRYGFNKEEFPDHFNEHVDGHCHLAVTSFKFSNSIYENDTLNHLDKLSKHNDWSQKLSSETNALRKEIESNNDIQLVDVVEVYRSLPMKMLLFYQSISNVSYDFALKTDDDCYVNLPAVLTLIKELAANGKDHLWIGNFRDYFAIDKAGKWAEHEYKAISYPPFACGSGYVLSSNIALWLARNINFLKVYQGEDTSLGIWLSAIRHRRVHDPRFSCTKNVLDEKDVLVIPENNMTEMKVLYQKYESETFVSGGNGVN